MSALSATSPRASAIRLPISSVTGRANCSARARSRAAALATTAARWAKVVCRQVEKHFSAVLRAVSNWAVVSVAKVRRISPSYGLTLW
jgi:hypothetical protein